MQHLSEEHRAFAVETFYKNNEFDYILTSVGPYCHFFTVQWFLIQHVWVFCWPISELCNPISYCLACRYLSTPPDVKCSQKSHKVTVAESLFLKNVFTANTRCSSDQCCIMTKGFKSLYPAMLIHCAIYKDAGLALNLNRLIISAPPCISNQLDVTLVSFFTLCSQLYMFRAFLAHL
jgi:hypothetical protein